MEKIPGKRNNKYFAVRPEPGGFVAEVLVERGEAAEIGLPVPINNTIRKRKLLRIVLTKQTNYGMLFLDAGLPSDGTAQFSIYWRARFLIALPCAIS